MRKLMWFTLGFGAACAFCAYSWMTEGLLIPALILAGLFVGLLIGSKYFKFLRIPAVVCLGGAVALLWFQTYSGIYISRASALDGQIADVTARCTDYSYQTDYGSAVEGILYLDGKSYRAKFYVSGDIRMEPGDVLKGAFKFKITTPEGEIDSKSHQGKGIFLLGYQKEDAELLKLAESPYWAFPAKLRRSLLEIMDRTFPRDTAFFAKALLLGDRTGIDYATNRAFKVSGISHVIAVSGLHVTILFTLINLLCLKRRWLVAILGIPTLCMFAAVAGFSPSIVRACMMQGLMILAMLFDKEYDGPTELAFACLVMLVGNPLVITSVSFQLSVGCMIGIFLFNRRIYDWICGKLGCGKKHKWVRMKRWFASSVSVTLSAMTMTTPLVAYYFHTISLIGPVTNLMTLWVISFVFYGIILVCILELLSHTAAIFVARIVSLPIRYVLVVSKTLAAIPLSAVYTRSIYIVAWLIFCYVLLAVFLASKKKKPGILASCAALSLCLAITASWIEPMLDGCRMTVLNVGQGQSILLQSEGKTYLVDCGGDDDEQTADLVAETLLSQGVSRLDGVILTHYDRDHAGGIFCLLSRIPADTVIMPDYHDEVADLLEQTLPGRIMFVNKDILLTYGTTKMTIYAPVVPDSGNESSLALLFQSGNCDILITGDRGGFGERILLKTAEIPDLEILVAGHHGSKHSTCEELLAATTPDVVAISVGENHYGHPAPELLERLKTYGCTVYRTDIHGNIIFRR